MSKFINVGFSNLINSDRILSILAPDTLPCKRLIAEARNNNRLIDCSSGRKTRAVLLLDNGTVVLLGLNAETIATRLNGEDGSV